MTENSKPLEILHIDVFYTLDKKLFMTAIDKFSKFDLAFQRSRCGLVGSVLAY